VTDLQVYFTLGIFGAVILAIAFDIVDMVVAALLGVSLMMLVGVLTGKEVLDAMRTGGGALSLLFGGMVVARVLAKTGIFERLGDRFLHATRGSGRRYLLLLLLLIGPVCAFLPNATTVILLAPVIIGVARALEVDFVGPMVLAAVISNSAGLLTLVGDPATFLVGSSIGMTFGKYLQQVSLGGLLAMLVIVPLLPRLMPDIWKVRRALSAERPRVAIERPSFVVLSLGVLLLMIVLFVLGEELPGKIVPPEVAIIAATLALLLVYGMQVEPLDDVIRDIDWKSLMFIALIFCLVEGFVKTGLLQGLALKLSGWFGMKFTLVALTLLAGIGMLSSLLANIPVVAASLVMTKGYLVAVEAVPETALAAGFSEWPTAVVPVFIAMMFGGTLGGNATLIGASSNIVSAGICAREGSRVTFGKFLRIGLPITLCQLAASAIYIPSLSWMTR
jgi:Na+/H+ antiporter NhaD/arsenite permease-like protein